MSHPALTPRPLTRAAIVLSPRASAILALAIGLFAVAWVVPQTLVALGFLLLGMTFLCVAFVVRFLALRHDRAQIDLFHTIDTFIENDAAPCFTTDQDGLLTYQNLAAKERFADAKGDTLSEFLGDLFASPAMVLRRLQNKAQISGSAREDLVLRRGHLRLSVHQIGRNGFVWRLDDISDRGPAGRTGENINLPMMTVSKTGTILFMNEALRRLMGGRQTSLDRVFTELPIKNGHVARVSAKDGTLNALICEISSNAGRREIYLLPDPETEHTEKPEWDLIDRLPVPLLKLDEDGRIITANKRAKTLLGDDEAVGTLLSQQVEGAGRPISEWFREVMAGRLLGRSEVVRALKPEGEVFLQVSLQQMIEPEGRRIVAVLQDATELKTMEAQYLQAQKMQSLGQLAGGIAHDFNNLLTAISGHADLLLLRHTESDPDFADLSQILQNSNRAATLVGKLLSFSRKQTLRPEIIDLTDVLGDLTHLLNRLVPETIHLDLSQDTKLLPIRADRHHLEQVLVNLVVNARDAMPEGGRIQLETRNIILSKALKRDRAIVPAGEYVTIKVVDQGCGIPDDKLTKIFEPFYTTKGVGKGTGLGLSMAYGIIKQTGGYIFVDSKIDFGTTFTLYLPVTEETPNDVQSIAPNPESLPVHVEETLQLSASKLSVPASTKQKDENDSIPDPNADSKNALELGLSEAEGSIDRDLIANITKATNPNPEDQKAGSMPLPTHSEPQRESGIVLLVEDEAPVRAFASRALRMRGFTVLEAENAEDALKTLEDETLIVDIFVTDVIMPGMDGPTWVSKALKARPGVKVVFVSGYAKDSISEHQARIPNSVFLPKPFSLSELTATVQRQLH